MEGPSQGAWSAAPVSETSRRACTSAHPNPAHCGKARSQGRRDGGEVTRDGAAPEGCPAAALALQSGRPLSCLWDWEIPAPTKNFSSSWNPVLGSPLLVRRCLHLLDWGGEQMAYACH